jgi:hypothetical protein
MVIGGNRGSEEKDPVVKTVGEYSHGTRDPATRAGAAIGARAEHLRGRFERFFVRSTHSSCGKEFHMPLQRRESVARMNK